MQHQKILPRRFILIGVAILIAGCNDHAELARQANEHAARQADQNREMAKLNQNVAEGTKRLVDADAQMRQEFLNGHHDLETERKEIANQLHRDPIIALAIQDAALLIACVLPIVLAIYVVRNCGQRTSEEGLAELLIRELASEEPILLPRLPDESLSSTPSLPHE